MSEGVAESDGTEVSAGGSKRGGRGRGRGRGGSARGRGRGKGRAKVKAVDSVGE